ncbi:MAG TPA: CopG family antitoxin [Pseudonocardiaceae bacterium]
MTMNKRDEQLPRSRKDLEKLAEYYDTHDTSDQMEHGEWVDPRPMVTTSLRLPAPLIAALKEAANAEGVRYNAFVRDVLQRSISGERAVEVRELASIREKLDRIERAVTHVPAPRTTRVPYRKKTRV